MWKAHRSCSSWPQFMKLDRRYPGEAINPDACAVSRLLGFLLQMVPGWLVCLQDEHPPKCLGFGYQTRTNLPVASTQWPAMSKMIKMAGEILFQVGSRQQMATSCAHFSHQPHPATSRIQLAQEHSLDDAFNNRIEVEETDLADDKMSYYSSQEMGKATGQRDGIGWDWYSCLMFFFDFSIERSCIQKTYWSPVLTCTSCSLCARGI